MKKFLLLTLVLGLFIPNLFSSVNYLSEKEYKDLSKSERLRYWKNLENELNDNIQRKEDASAQKISTEKDIATLETELKTLNSKYVSVRNEIMEKIGVSDSELPEISEKLENFNNRLDNWNNLSDDELWKAKKDIKEFQNEYNTFKESKYAKVPDFRNEIRALENRVISLEKSLEYAKPKYFEDEYTVKDGDTLSKIAGFEHIYNDYSKWGIIYRANRDKISDPNLIYIDQVINIPRGLPYTWKVYKGEFLWKIASYPEIYGDGSQWTKIYEANRDQIKNQDMIYPNQEFEIPRD